MIEYEINGYFAAPGYFAVNPSTGAITVRADLGSDVATSYLVWRLVPFSIFLEMYIFEYNMQ